MTNAKKALAFALASLVVGIVGMALMEAARRRGLIRELPQDALANLLSPRATVPVDGA